mgnify:FL=1
MDKGKMLKPKPAAPKSGKPGSTKGVPYPSFTTKTHRTSPREGKTLHPRPFK